MTVLAAMEHVVWPMIVLGRVLLLGYTAIVFGGPRRTLRYVGRGSRALNDEVGRVRVCRSEATASRF